MPSPISLATVLSLFALGHAAKFTLYEQTIYYPITGTTGGTQTGLIAQNYVDLSCDTPDTCDAHIYAWDNGNVCSATDGDSIEVCGQQYIVRNFNNGGFDCAEFAQNDDTNSKDLQNGDIYGQLQHPDGSYVGACRVNYDAPNPDVSHCFTVSGSTHPVLDCEVNF